LTFSIATSEIKKSNMVKFLGVGKFALKLIVTELASAYGKQADAKKAVEYWIHPSSWED
jgi:hypothetical protein